MFILSSTIIAVACLFIGCGATNKVPTLNEDDSDAKNSELYDSLVSDIIWQSEITNDEMDILRSSLIDQQMKNGMKKKLSAAMIEDYYLAEGEEITKRGFFLQRSNQNGQSSEASRLLKRSSDILTNSSTLTQRSAGNICLEPPDPLRTCFRRSKDPENHFDCDFIDRNQYNQKGEYGVLPYLDTDEHIFHGKLIISLLDNEHDVNSCDSRLRMEELLLTFLADNIGNPDTFTPICAYMTEYMFDSQQVPETDNKSVSGTSFNFDLTFAQTARVQDWRHLESNSVHDEEETENVIADRDLRKDKKKNKNKNKKNRADKKDSGKKNNGNKNGNGKKKKKKKKGSNKKKNGSGKNDRGKDKGDGRGKDRDFSRPSLSNCRASDQALCCSQVAINGSPGVHCTELDCDFSLCGSGRKAFQPVDNTWVGAENSWSSDGWSGRQRKLVSRKLSSFSKGYPDWFDNFSGSSHSHNSKSYYCPAYSFLKTNNNEERFNAAVNEVTPYNPMQSYSQLDINFLFANDCSMNRFSLNKYDLPSLVCTRFRDEECVLNNDLLPPVQSYYPIFCIDDSTYRKYFIACALTGCYFEF